MTRIAVFNVKYSPNLGDGLLSECLEHQLRDCDPGFEIVSLDLAGRQYYGATVSNRQLALRVLEVMPAALRSLVARLALNRLARRRLQPAWGRELATCSAGIIGGGNLFADADLNFPIKISVALRELAKCEVPVAVFAVGVTRNWSAQGRRMFTEGLLAADLIDATVRDERSRTIWNDMLVHAGVRPAGLAYDPGLLTAQHFPAAASDDGMRPEIGLCITNPVALRYHAPRSIVTGTMTQWYDTAIAALSRAGNAIALFTNGSPEDKAFLALHSRRWTANPNVRVVQGFERPAQLAGFISTCVLVIAHRMHACIAAHSYGIPTIGLAWDLKLDSFFQSVGRSAWMVDPKQVDAADMPDRVAEAITEGVDLEALAAVTTACRNDIARLASLIARATEE